MQVPTTDHIRGWPVATGKFSLSDISYPDMFICSNRRGDFNSLHNRDKSSWHRHEWNRNYESSTCQRTCDRDHCDPQHSNRPTRRAGDHSNSTFCRDCTLTTHQCKILRFPAASVNAGLFEFTRACYQKTAFEVHLVTNRLNPRGSLSPFSHNRNLWMQATGLS